MNMDQFQSIFYAICLIVTKDLTKTHQKKLMHKISAIDPSNFPTTNYTRAI